MSDNYLHILKDITTFVFDVDGVLTDGSITLVNGDQARRMNIKDGYALQLAVKKGYHIGVISGGRSEAVRTRFQKLGIHNVYLGAENKLEVLDEYMLTYDLQLKNMLYMGDDIPDYEVMQRVALPCCPSDAAPEIQRISKYISDKNGGEGCVRDIMEKVMKIQGKWFDPEHIEKKFEEFKW